MAGEVQRRPAAADGVAPRGRRLARRRLGGQLGGALQRGGAEGLHVLRKLREEFFQVIARDSIRVTVGARHCAALPLERHPQRLDLAEVLPRAQHGEEVGAAG